jgi:hypothetical protein
MLILCTILRGAGAESNIYGSATLVDIKNFYLPTLFFNFLYYTNFKHVSPNSFLPGCFKKGSHYSRDRILLSKMNSSRS